MSYGYNPFASTPAGPPWGQQSSMTRGRGRGRGGRGGNRGGGRSRGHEEGSAVVPNRNLSAASAKAQKVICPDAGDWVCIDVHTPEGMVSTMFHAPVGITGLDSKDWVKSTPSEYSALKDNAKDPDAHRRAALRKRILARVLAGQLRDVTVADDGTKILIGGTPEATIEKRAREAAAQMKQCRPAALKFQDWAPFTGHQETMERLRAARNKKETKEWVSAKALEKVPITEGYSTKYPDGRQQAAVPGIRGWKSRDLQQLLLQNLEAPAPERGREREDSEVDDDPDLDSWLDQLEFDDAPNASSGGFVPPGARRGSAASASAGTGADGDAAVPDSAAE